MGLAVVMLVFVIPNVIKIMKTDKIYYFFENEQGLWLKDGSRTETTNDPNKAAKLADKFEADLFRIGLKGFKVTEHVFVVKNGA